MQYCMLWLQLEVSFTTTKAKLIVLILVSPKIKVLMIMAGIFFIVMKCQCPLLVVKLQVCFLLMNGICKVMMNTVFMLSVKNLSTAGYLTILEA